MARDHKMVSSCASVPIWVFIRNDPEIIIENTNQAIAMIVGDRAVDILHNVCDTNRYEECVCLIRMTGHEWAQSALHLIYEVAFNGVDVFRGTNMYNGQLPFSVGPYLESLQHLYVTPIKWRGEKAIIKILREVT